MTMQGSGTRTASAVLLAGLIAGGSLGADAAGASQVKLESGPAGELALRARGATIEQTLQALAAKVGFAVVIAGELPRKTADLTLSLAPVEKLLHEILRGRNYAVLYDGTSDALSRVIVLPAASTRGAYAAPRRPPAKPRGGQPAGPIVIRATANGQYAVPQPAPANRRGGKPAAKPAGAMVVRQ